jgi:peptidyl-prolyl cis-trans isomerase B (cyclophilin B)
MIMKTIKYIFFLLLASSLMTSCGSIRTGGQREQRVLIRTTEGDITLKLYNETPLHRDNFIRLVRSRAYDNTVFHRVIPEFMIQGGDTRERGRRAADINRTIPAEIRTPAIYHRHGALAAARISDVHNPTRRSSADQFYIVVGRVFTDEQLDEIQERIITRYALHENDPRFIISEQARHDYKTIGGTPHLDGTYTIFGRVLSGMDVVERISQVETGEGNRPVEEVRILRMRLRRR